MTWRINNCFVPLNRQLRVKYPRIVIYSIGDPAHQAKTSDHNPNKYGRVNAEDYMLRNGFNNGAAIALCERLIQDSRTKNVIYDRRIWEHDTQEWRPYGGSNPHTDHVHHSVFDGADDETQNWVLEQKRYVMSIPLTGFALPVVTVGDDDSEIAGYNYVTRAQLLLNFVQEKTVTVDGVYGPQTVAAVKNLPTENDGKSIKLPEWSVLYGFAKAAN